MKNILMFGDLHILERDVGECQEILAEIISLTKKYEIDAIVNLGDTFDTVSPTPPEQDLYSQFVSDVNLPIIQIVAKSHESISEEQSVLNHYGILTSNVKILHEHIDPDYLYCGHFLIKQSQKNYGGTVDKDTLKNYKYVILGHGHSAELISPNICQLGASRYVDFAESKDEDKLVLILQDYKGPNEKVIFIPLISPIPMIDIHLSYNSETKDYKVLFSNVKYAPKGKENDFLGCLEAISEKSKVRVLLEDFESWKYYLSNKSEIKKFTLFKEEKKFLLNTAILEQKEEIQNFKASLENWLSQQKIDIEIKNVLLEELK